MNDRRSYNAAGDHRAADDNVGHHGRLTEATMCSRYNCPRTASIKVSHRLSDGTPCDNMALCTEHAQEHFRKEWSARHDET